MTLCTTGSALTPCVCFPRRWKEFIGSKKEMDEMSLEDFLSHWNISREDLAVICECSIDTVAHWFVRGKSRRKPESHHRRRLADAHRELMRMKLEASLESRYKGIYNKIQNS